MEAPEFYVGNYFGGVGVSPADFTMEKRVPDKNSGENFAVDDLLDFSNEDMIMTDGFFDNVHGNSTDSSTVTAVESCNSSFSGCGDSHFSSSSANLGSRAFCADSQFSGELCVPYDELAQLEWLSNFVEDSFSTEQNNLHILSASKPPTPDSSSSSTRTDCAAAGNSSGFSPEIPLPGKVRSKRSRSAPGGWSTRLLHLSSQKSAAASKKRESANQGEPSGRKCLHCGTEKTPQWRTGPMGPKTLCNACGVRYKSGRLVPEYRPAASPTFVSTKHSNSHRKVLELRRQKELQRRQQQFISQSSLFGVANGGDEFLIHRHMI